MVYKIWHHKRNREITATRAATLATPTLSEFVLHMTHAIWHMAKQLEIAALGNRLWSDLLYATTPTRQNWSEPQCPEGSREGGNNSNSNLAINSKHTWKTKRNPRSKSQHKSWVLRACHMREGERGREREETEREGRGVGASASARRQWVERQLWSCEYEWEWGSTPLGSINREHTLEHTRTYTNTHTHTHTYVGS